MGEHVNNRTLNIITWVTVAIMIVLTLLMVGTSLFQS
jgi:Mn2+/Fe2+ NRAMP family transporter